MFQQPHLGQSLSLALTLVLMSAMAITLMTIASGIFSLPGQ